MAVALERVKEMCRFWFKVVSLFILILAFASIRSHAFDDDGFKSILNLSVAIVQVQNSPQADDAPADSLVRGVVTSQKKGTPLADVLVMVAGTNIVTYTNEKGEYSITAPENEHTLVFSLLGYVNKRVDINDRDTVSVSLVRKLNVIEKELVVVGYGTRRREDLTGAISSITKAELENLSITSAEQALQGRVPGVRVIKNSGAPGGGSTVRIRGINSIRAGNNPLYVVDGLPISGGSSPSQNPLSLINPNDIVSIEVLKDASATAIYGARGANGVVLITTRQGQAGETRVNLEVSYGVNEVRNKLNLLNTRQFVALANEAATNSGQDPIFTQPANSYPNTDWQDQVFRTAPQQNYQLSVSGGNEDTRYVVSANFYNEKGIIIGSEYQRGSFRINFDKQVSDKFSIGNNLILTRAHYRLVNTAGRGLAGIINGALQIPPVAPVKDRNGNYVFQTENTIERPNPVASALEKTNESMRFKGVGNLFAIYEFTDHLQARVSIGGNLRYRKSNFYAPKTTLQGQQNNSVAEVSTRQAFQWINENTLTYENEFLGLHDLKILAGFTLQRNTGESLRGESEGFITDAYRYSNLGAGELPSNPASGARESALVSYIGRVNYSFDDRYLFTLTGRIDGSSRFGAGNRYGFFPSAAFAWRITEEAFMEQQDFFSKLKLRLSYGVTGNQAIDNFAALPLLGFSQVTFGNRVLVGINPSSLGNEKLKWEKTTQYNAGLDVGLFNNRIMLSGDVYYKKTSDLLLRKRVPRYTGYSSFLANIGSTENYGFGLSLNTVNVNSGDFRWTSSVTYSMNRNKVLELADDRPLFVGTPIAYAGGQSFRILKEGGTLGAFYGYVYGGVYRDQEQIEKLAPENSNAQPGDPYLLDIGGGPNGGPDGVINEADRTIIGNALPDFTFGFTNNFYFKGFDLSIFIQGVYGNKIMNMNKLRLESVRGYTNQTQDVLNRWTPENRVTNIPKASRSRGSAAQTAMRAISTRLVEDGSYVRLKNITLGYTFPVEWTGEIGVRSLRLYVTGINLITLTNYSGYDPDVSTYNNLGNIGADYGTYPKAKTFLIGINLGF